MRLFDLPALPLDLQTLLVKIEDGYIADALEFTKGNKKEAAKLLGMNRTTLVEKLRRRGKGSMRLPVRLSHR